MATQNATRPETSRIIVHNMIDEGAFTTEEEYTPAQTAEIQRMLKLVARRVTGAFDPELVEEVDVTRRGK